MADNASLSPAREARRAPSKRRASSVSPDTESSQARAQPGEPRRDENTLDLFAGDLSHAPVQAMETHRRQDAQGGFGSQEPEQHEVEAAQVAAIMDSAPADVVVSRNGAHTEDGAAVTVDATPRDAEEVGEAAAQPEFVAMTSASSELATESVVPVTADADGGAGLASAESAPAQAEPVATEPMLPGRALAQLHVARTASAPRAAKSGRAASRAVKANSAAAGSGSSTGPDQSPVTEDAPYAEVPPASGSLVSQTSYAAAFAHAAVAAGSASVDARPASLELNRGQPAPIADTIDALHNVIADQRRMLTDLSRRMKWTLGAVVGTLLVTVAAGVAQTVVLARLATDASAQQQRIAQMMQDQQAALAAMQAHLPPAAEAPAGQPASPNLARPAVASPARHVQHAKHARVARSTAQ